MSDALSFIMMLMCQIMFQLHPKIGESHGIFIWTHQSVYVQKFGFMVTFMCCPMNQIQLKTGELVEKNRWTYKSAILLVLCCMRKLNVSANVTTMAYNRVIH